MRMVREGWKPSLRDASCWRREVMKGGVGWRRRSLRSTLVTVQSAPASPASTSSTRALASRRKLLWSSFWPATSASRAATGGGRLHAARREPAAHLVPEQRRELVADQPVEDAARLLRVEAVAVELAGLLERFEDRLLRDLVEQHAVDVLPPRAELLRDVPGDGFALAVGVGRQVDVLLVLGGLLDVLEHLRLALDDVVLGREVALDVDPELRLGQVHHVADGGLHLVVPPEVLAERLGFGRRLDDDEVLGHVLHAARRQKRLPGSWQTRPRSSSARS